MKYLILIEIFGLFSCKSEGEKLDDLQQNEVETVLTENVTEIDTTSFMEFFELDMALFSNILPIVYSAITIIPSSCSPQ